MLIRPPPHSQFPIITVFENRIEKQGTTVSASIRSFRNTDIPELCRLWNTRLHPLGEFEPMTPQQMEVVALGKPYFVPDQLLVAEAPAGELVGFLHAGPLSNDSMSDWDVDRCGIFALYATGSDAEEVLRAMLLTALDSALTQASVVYLQPPLPQAAYYLGFGPGDAMAGTDNSALPVDAVAQQVGFEVQEQWMHWELSLATFHPPIDRMQLMVRRSAEVQRGFDEPQLPWWLACVFGHADLLQYRLLAHSDQRCLGDALLWALPLELPQAQGRIWMFPLTATETSEAQAAQTFLLAEAFRDLQNQRVDTICTACRADDAAVIGVLDRLGFVCEFQGNVLVKR
ncbi:MAG: GNAT family N-acetyltransferase [Planctomycetota bacterium]|nr:MAG: GNAT family N-acetyltransferase [Planctomycetota bacterium]